MASPLSKPGTAISGPAEAPQAIEDERRVRRLEAEVERLRAEAEELREAGAALRASEAQYRRLVEGLEREYVIYGNDLEGKFTYVSPSAKTVLGYEPDEMIGRDWRDLVPSEQSRSLAEHYQALAFRGERTPAIPIEVRHANGGSRLIEVLARPVCDQAQKVIGIEGIGKDITEAKRVEEALIDAKEELDRRVRERTAELDRRLEFERLLVSLSTDFINLPVSRLSAGVVDALRQIGEFTGMERCYVYRFNDANTHAELAYQWSAPNSPSMGGLADRVAIKDHNWTIGGILTGEPVHVPSLDVMPDAASASRNLLRSIGVRSFINVPMVASDRVQGYLGILSFSEEKFWPEEHITLLRLACEVFLNVFEREQAERARRQSEQRLRLAIEGGEGGLFDWEISTGRLVVSDSTRRTFGLTDGAKGATISNWRARIHPDDADRVDRAFRAHFAGESPTYDFEYRMRRVDGVYRWRYARGRIVECNPSGQPLRMLGIDRDVTDRVRQRQKMRQLETQLAHLGRVATMGETVAGIAHEVNQPLHAAATLCTAAHQALASGREDALQCGAELYQKVSEQVTRAGDIIRRLREFTRPQPMQATRLDPGAVIREAAALVTDLSPRDDISLRLDLEEPLQAVDGDAVQLQQVIVNLLQNAYDSLTEHRGESPRISVSARSTAATVEVLVSDNGPGCNYDEPEDLFDAFFTTKPNGMGIGLTLCRTILEAHLGKISAENNPSGGMTFKLTLPAAREGES